MPCPNRVLVPNSDTAHNQWPSLNSYWRGTKIIQVQAVPYLRSRTQLKSSCGSFLTGDQRKSFRFKPCPSCGVGLSSEIILTRSLAGNGHQAISWIDFTHLHHCYAASWRITSVITAQLIISDNHWTPIGDQRISFKFKPCPICEVGHSSKVLVARFLLETDENRSDSSRAPVAK